MTAQTQPQVGYDDFADVLYVYTEPHLPYRAVEDTDGITWRYRADSGEPLGVTVEEFKEYWLQHRPQLARKMAKFFRITRGEVDHFLPSK
jgi:hypothetical protein